MGRPASKSVGCENRRKHHGNVVPIGAGPFPIPGAPAAMIRRLRATSTCLMLLGGLAASSPAKVLDRTLATINGQAILLSDFEKNATPILENFRKATPPADQTPERIADIKKRVLDQMID